MGNEYTPTVWRTGDVITAEKLNKIEEGIANAENELLVTLETYTIEAQTITGEYDSEYQWYSKEILLGEAVIPPEYDENYTYRLFGKINDGTLMSEPLIKEFDDICTLEIFYNFDDNESIAIFHSYEPFTLNLETHTIEFLRASKSVADVFGEMSPLDGK